MHTLHRKWIRKQSKSHGLKVDDAVGTIGARRERASERVVSLAVSKCVLHSGLTLVQDATARLDGPKSKEVSVVAAQGSWWLADTASFGWLLEKVWSREYRGVPSHMDSLLVRPRERVGVVSWKLAV